MIDKFITPVQYLLSVVNSEEPDLKIKVDAAKALLPYFHSKKPQETIVEVREPITAIERKII